MTESKVWNALIDIQHLLEKEFARTGTEVFEPGMDRFNQPGWINRVWTSDKYRRAHVDVVDARDTKGLWMMHCCIYPHYHNTSPIFGFDVFAGKNKITGCFHDFSPVVSEHPLSDWFSQHSAELSWNKKRELPEWGKRIFSDSIIAAGNVQNDIELSQIANTIEDTITTYISSLHEYNNTVEDISNKHKYYIENQILPSVMKILRELGVREEDLKFEGKQAGLGKWT